MNTTASFKDIYQNITESVISSLEKGNIIWLKGWHSFGLPRNISTGKTYRGWNVFWLNFHARLNGYTTPYYLTFNQAKAMSGFIKKGEKGTQITYWATVENHNQMIEVLDENTGEASTMHSTRLIPKVHTVFNIDQTQGIEFPQVEKLFRSDAEKIEACERVISGMQNRPFIKIAGDRACYNQVTDTVTIPDIELFHSDQEYYCTFFHELGHSTGHRSRLNRKELLDYDGFGGENYSKEELTAEFTAAYLSAVTGIEQSVLTNSAAYIQGWLKALKEDKTLVFKAAAQAQKAADYILGVDGYPQSQVKSPDKGFSSTL